MRCTTFYLILFPPDCATSTSLAAPRMNTLRFWRWIHAMRAERKPEAISLCVCLASLARLTELRLRFAEQQFTAQANFIHRCVNMSGIDQALWISLQVCPIILGSHKNF